MISQHAVEKNGSSAKPEDRLILEPLLVGTRGLARLLSISVATLERWNAAGRLGPAGAKIGGRRLWPLAEVKAWVSSGMPRRETWQAMKKAGGTR